ncbi:sigma factor-like helix-turn-helix DNA-binding protein [Trinickia soli]|uniref:sigma factor-like helix-turn-helix DNA-binding protein n=1 Tax=Trinickia soli TaxID=380675 RepID=UPI001E43BA31|nr:sigma factor-like helix-turn-helix DNA-binding protein [Trinickia soli]
MSRPLTCLRVPANAHIYDEIARQTGVSGEHVRRIEQHALETLRTSAQASAARSFLAAQA